MKTKSAILSLLGFNLKSNIHFDSSLNESADLLREFVTKTHCCALSSTMASLFITPALDHGFQNLIEGNWASKDVNVIYLHKEKNKHKFQLVAKIPCFNNNLYIDFLCDEISPDDRKSVRESLFLEVILECSVDFQKQTSKVDIQSLILSNINRDTFCLLEDVLAYCYEQSNDIIAIRKQLNKVLDINEIIGLDNLQSHLYSPLLSA